MAPVHPKPRRRCHSRGTAWRLRTRPAATRIQGTGRAGGRISFHGRAYHPRASRWAWTSWPAPLPTTTSCARGPGQATAMHAALWPWALAVWPRTPRSSAAAACLRRPDGVTGCPGHESRRLCFSCTPMGRLRPDAAPKAPRGALLRRARILIAARRLDGTWNSLCPTSPGRGGLPPSYPRTRPSPGAEGGVGGNAPGIKSGAVPEGIKLGTVLFFNISLSPTGHPQASNVEPFWQ